MIAAARSARVALGLLAAAVAAAGAAPSGHLAYVKDGLAWVHPIGGKAVLVPGSEHASRAWLAPLGGAVLVSTRVKLPDDKDEPSGLVVVVSTPPYRASKPLDLPRSGWSLLDVVWSADGQRAWLDGAEDGRAYEVASGKLSPTNYAALTTAAPGGLVLYRSPKELRARWTATGNDAALFSIGRPEALFAAIKAARNPGRLKDLTEALDPAMWHDEHQWQVSDPALMPDGKRLFFATNAGTGAGGHGNCSWCLFACDVEGGKLAVLSRLGSQYGRVPHWLAVSPDGKRLGRLDSLHDNVADNPCGLHVTELETQADRELLWTGHKPDKETCTTSAACWSPDSHYIVLSVVWYDPDKALKDQSWNKQPRDFTSVAYDVVSGKVAFSLPGADLPTWGK